jgi:hypothetical protein
MSTERVFVVLPGLAGSGKGWSFIVSHDTSAGYVRDRGARAHHEFASPESPCPRRRPAGEVIRSPLSSALRPAPCVRAAHHRVAKTHARAADRSRGRVVHGEVWPLLVTSGRAGVCCVRRARRRGSRLAEDAGRGASTSSPQSEAGHLGEPMHARSAGTQQSQHAWARNATEPLSRLQPTMRPKITSRELEPRTVELHAGPKASKRPESSDGLFIADGLRVPNLER